MSNDFHALMSAAQPAERTVPICLRGDLVAELEDLEREHQKARRRGRSASMEDGGTTAAILTDIEAKQAEMEACTYTFRLRQLSPLRYRQLKTQHPPRRGDDDQYDPGDLNIGFNRETMFPVLVRACTVDPQLSDADWRDLLGDSESEAAAHEAAGSDVNEGKLAYSQWVELANAAYEVNEGGVSVPFSLAALRERQSSGGE